MKTIVKIFYWLVGILAVLVLISFLLPKMYKVEKSLFIKAHPDVVYRLTSNFQQWHLWVPWTKEIDTTAVFVMTGPTAQVGTSWRWNGKILGNGEMTLTNVVQDQLVAYDLEFNHGKYRSKGKIVMESKGDSSKVSWIDEGDLGYNPISRFMGLFMDRMMGPDFVKGLAKLKTVSESRAGWPKIEEVTMGKQVALVICDSAGPKTYSMVMGRAYGEIMSFIRSNKLKVTGPPFSVTVKWDSVTMSSTMDMGIPVEKAGNGKGRVQVRNFPEQKVVLAHYFGPYEKTGTTYHVLEQYIKENDEVITGAPREVYITDPMNEKDTLKWATNIAFPVK